MVFGASCVEHVVAAPARLVRPASEEFRRAGLALLQALSPGRGCLVLNLSRTEDADSVGVAALISLRRRARALGVPVVLRGVTPAMRELLRMARLEAQFEIEP
jgi:anti-anti-sigma regulatory factor